MNINAELVPVITTLIVAIPLCAMWAVALVDVFQRSADEFPPLASGGQSRSMWLLVVILFSGIGSLAYYALVMRPFPRRRD